MSQPSGTPGRPRRPLRRFVIVLALAGVIAVGAGSAWFLFLRPSGPPPVGPSAPAIPAAPTR